MASTYNLPDQYNGDTFEQIQFNLYDNDSTSGNEKDLSSTTPTFTIRRDKRSGTIVKTLTIGDGLEWVNQSNGQFQITEFLIDWGAGFYFYDLQIEFSATNKRTYLNGVFQTVDDITDQDGNNIEFNFIHEFDQFEFD